MHDVLTQQILDTDKKIIRRIKSLIRSQEYVSLVIDISSGQFHHQGHTLHSDCDLVIVVDNRPPTNDFSQLVHLLEYLLKRHSELFPHKFIVVPDTLWKDFVRIRIYENSKIERHAKRFHVDLYRDRGCICQFAFSEFEWSVQGYLLAKRMFTTGRDNNLTIKYYRRAMYHALNMKSWIFHTMPYPWYFHKRERTHRLSEIKTESVSLNNLLLLRKQIINNAEELFMLLRYNSTISIKLIVHKAWYGYILFVPAFASVIIDKYHLLPQRFRLKILTSTIDQYFNVQEFFHDTLQPSSIYLREFMQRKKFFRRWNTFLIESGLNHLSYQPMGLKLFIEGWKDIITLQI